MSDFSYRKLGELCTILSSKRIFAKEYVESGVPFYRSKEIIQKHNGENINTELFISEQRFSEIESKYGVPKENDMLMTSVGTLGVAYVVSCEDRFYFKDGNLTWYKDFFPELNSKYLFYLFGSELGKDLIKSVTIGSSQAALTIDGMKNLEVPCPDICIQEKIVKLLKTYDNLIENNNRRIAILEEMAQKLYREWFVHFRFPRHENVKLVESEMGLIPEGWEVDVFSQAVDVNPKYPKPSAPYFSFVDMAGLETNRMIVSIKEQRPSFSGAKFSNGDTLVARITPCLENGKTGFVQCLVDGEIGTGSTEFIVLKSKKLSAEFVYLLSRQDDFRGTLIKSMSGASGRQRANANVLNDFLVCIPSRTVLTTFSAFAEPAFKEIEQLNRKNINLRKTRDLLLPRLISGDIDVSELDIPIKEGQS